MAKTKEKIFTDMVFNDAVYAKKIYDETDIRMKRNTIAIGCSIVATILDFVLAPNLAGIFFKDDLFFGSLVFWAVFAAVVFAIGGGFKNALSTCVKIGKIVWFVIPIFPADIIIGLSFGLTALILVLWFPIVFVLINRVQISKDRKAAAQYMSSFEERPTA